MALPLFIKKLLVRTRLARLLPGTRKLLDGGIDFLHYYGDELLAAPIEELLDPATFPEAHGPDTIHLAMPAPRPEPGSLPNTRVSAERRGSLDPWGLAELRTEIAESRLEAVGQRLNPGDEVLITHGATGAVRTVLDAFVNAGSKVVVFDPCSPIFTLGLKHRRARIARVPTWLEEGRTRFHMRPLVRAMKGARLLVLADPANPTGGTLAPEDLEQIAWWANHYDVLICLDESFGGFRYEHEGANTLPNLPHAQRRTIAVGSVSKSHGLPGLRVGWMSGYRHLIRPCAVVSALRTPFVPVACQQMALSAIQGEESRREEFGRKRQYVVDRLKMMGLRPEWPSGGFFVWVPVTSLGLTGREFAQQLMKSQKVLVNAGDVYGPSGVGFVRLSYAIDEGRLREGLTRMTRFVRELRGGAVVEPEEQPSETEPSPVAVA